ncbi:MAG TPA: lysophospholipid acyltransferase family protein [Dongiaceae bacterium]|nr:lysophospholipid acyltransferase family protein [Dongiaceae bacterium]
MQEQADATTGMVLHRPRSLGARPMWQWSDIAIAGSLLALLPPSWLLPEPIWPLLCRAVCRVPGIVGGATLRRTIANIRAALAGLDPAQAASVALDLQAAVYELRMQNLRSWRPGGWQPDIALRGEEHLVRALDRGKGAVLWVAHFAFNSGITKMALQRRGHRVSHLSRPEHGFSKTRFGIACLNPVRCVPEDRHIAERIVYDRNAPSTAMRRMVRVLNAGGIVSITAGAWEGSGLAAGPLLGGTLSLATGAPRLALLTGADLLPVFSIRDRERRFTTVIESPVPLSRNGPPAESCGNTAIEYLARHEPWLRQFPEQWRGWKEWRSPSRSEDRS